MSGKTAVVLLNLGGPDSPAAVRPFLINLFSDPAIIGAPGPVRWLVARIIAARRAKPAGAIYAHLGGGSPLLANTEAQATALDKSLGQRFRVFISMRYWVPRAAETAAAVRAWGAKRVILLPLYPQFSTATSASSVADWKRGAESAGLSVPTLALCCFPAERGFIEAMADLTAPCLAEARLAGRTRVLFSAHGLPEKIIARGDPYQWQIEASAAAIGDRLGLAGEDWRVCYQSRVGPLQWIGPSTEAEIARAGDEKSSVVVVPLSFVSEHSETLVELDIDYAELARKSGVPRYLRVPTVSTHHAFIACLARLVRAADGSEDGWVSRGGRPVCPAERGRCPHAGRLTSQHTVIEKG